MNWGWSIVLAFSLFGLFIGWLVFRTFQETIELVSEDYYQQELGYQQQIDKMTNNQALPVPLTFSQQAQQLVVQFPAEPAAEVQGEIHLFRPSDARRDQILTIALNPQRQQIIATEGLVKGHYRVKVDWTSGDAAYYTEETVFIQ
ncbi:MAG: FixH family protein [Tunicatimonas sp.]